ncbi:cation-translocating P-type ATPase [Deltaproteobacteria bacterium TL4]
MNLDLFTQQPKYISIRVTTAFMGTGLLINGYLFNYFNPDQQQIGLFAIFLSILMLSFPIFIRAIYSFMAQEVPQYSEALIFLAVIAAIAIEDYLAAAIVPIAMTLSHALEEKSIVGAREAIEGLKKLSAKTVIKIEGDQQITVNVEQLQVGETILLMPGDLIPCDGEVIEGVSTLNQATITGESLPVDVSPGKTIFAGTSNLSGVLKAKVSKLGKETALGKIEALFLEAEKTKSPLMKIFDRYAKLYLPLVLMLSVIVWYYTNDMIRAITILIFACPCAFVLAPSSAVIASLAVLSRLGILIKDTKFLELASQIDTIVFDKTGTVTYGALSVVSVDFNEAKDQKKILSLAYCLANNSKHPASRAIIAYCEKNQVSPAKLEGVKEQQAKGMMAEALIMGRRSWLEEMGVTELPESSPDTEVLLAENKTFLARFIFVDTPRPNVKNILERLRTIGVERLILVSGDRKEITAKIAQELNFDEFFADHLPHEKLDRIAIEKSAERVVCMVGDGTNDSLALAAGDISIAMGKGGSDIAIKAADIAFMSNNLDRLPMLIELSKKTIQTININFLIAIIWGASLLTLSALGFFSPISAAILHNGGAFLVILNSGNLLKQYSTFNQ